MALATISCLSAIDEELSSMMSRSTFTGLGFGDGGGCTHDGGVMGLTIIGVPPVPAVPPIPALPPAPPWFPEAPPFDDPPLLAEPPFADPPAPPDASTSMPPS